MKTPSISLSNSSILDKEFLNLLTAKDDEFILAKIDPMLEEAHFYFEGVLNSKKCLTCVDPQSIHIENDIIPALEIIEQILFQWIAGKVIEKSSLDAWENSKFYDEMWLFRREDWLIKFLHMISLSCQDGEFSKWRKCWVVACRCNSIFRKGSFFSQLVNGFM